MRKAALCLWLGMVMLVVSASAQTKRGETVYKADFNAPDALAAWAGAKGVASLESTPESGQALKIEQPLATGMGSPKVVLSLPVEKLRGTRLLCTAQGKAQNVAQPPKSYQGVKFMLHIVSPGGEDWPQQNNLFGTFEWKPLEFAAMVPANAEKVELILGLEATTGAVWFDDIALKVVGLNAPRPRQPPTGPMYKGHDLPRLRGVMVNPKISADDLRALSGWKANHIRWQLAWFGSPADEAGKADLARFDAWLDQALAHLDEMLPLCEQLGIKVVVDLHSPPGGRNAKNECNLFNEKRYQENFLNWWEKIARRYQDKSIVWGYDLLNEPVEGVNDATDWHELATQAAKRIRAIDTKHAIIVEPAPWGNPSTLVHFTPIEVPGVVYSVHMYDPHTFTHQGVRDYPLGFDYPGQINGIGWDKAQIRRALKPVIDFQRDYNVHIYTGEFSAIRWAPHNSAYNYLRDCIEVFEENNWDWAYHAFREYEGWSVEHGTDKSDTKPSATPTDRQQLLQSWFAKNTLANAVQAAPAKSPMQKSAKAQTSSKQVAPKK